MDWAKTTARGYKKTIKFGDLVRLILEVLRYIPVKIEYNYSSMASFQRQLFINGLISVAPFTNMV